MGILARQVWAEVMTDPFFDYDNGDSAARLLLADHYAERGDERAAGYRWMAERDKSPLRVAIAGYACIAWLRDREPSESFRLSPQVFDLIDGVMDPEFEVFEYPSIIAAEEALCRAVLTLEGESVD